MPEKNNTLLENIQHEFYHKILKEGVLPIQSRTTARELQTLGVSRLIDVVYESEIKNYILTTNKGKYYLKHSDIDYPFINLSFNRPIKAQ